MRVPIFYPNPEVFMRVAHALIALSSLLFTATGCADDDDSSSSANKSIPDVDQDEFFRWTVGGNTITSKDDSRFHGYLYTDITNSLQINGRADDAQTGMRINFIGLDAGTTGTFDLMSTVDTTLVYTEAGDPLVDYVASPLTGQNFSATGSVTITSYDEAFIEGTFAFVGYDQVTTMDTRDVTEGSFRIAVR